MIGGALHWTQTPMNSLWRKTDEMNSTTQINFDSFGVNCVCVAKPFEMYLFKWASNSLESNDKKQLSPTHTNQSIWFVRFVLVDFIPFHLVVWVAVDRSDYMDQ